VSGLEPGSRRVVDNQGFFAVTLWLTAAVVAAFFVAVAFVLAALWAGVCHAWRWVKR
jgi:hypothetical protein